MTRERISDVFLFYYVRNFMLNKSSSSALFFSLFLYTPSANIFLGIIKLSGNNNYKRERGANLSLNSTDVSPHSPLKIIFFLCLFL